MKNQLLIAGGGIGGMAAALAAQRAGWQAQLFERAPVFSEVGAGVQLGPNVVRCLQAWGLQEALQSVAAFPQRLQVRCALSGRELAELALGSRAVQRYGAAYATIHRADLHGLLAHAVQQSGADVQQDVSIEYHRSGDHGVTLGWGQGQEAQGEALIGADGLWSRIRHTVVNDTPPRVTGHLAYRALVPQVSLPLSLRTAQVTVWLGPHLHMVQYPVRRGEMQNLVAIIQGAAPENLQDWDHSANAVDLERALSGTCTALQDAIRGVAGAGWGWRLWPLCDRPPMQSASDMASGRVALLGDAAHPMRPYLAQGAGMAIEDAAELERVLALHDLEVPLRLRRYARQRWQRNARVQARSIRNGRIFHATGPMRWARDLVLQVMGGVVLDQPWLYRGNDSRSIR